MKVTTTEGTVFEGRDAKEVVSQMRRDQWAAPALKAEYMAEVSDRVEQITGGDIRDDNAEAFLTSLEAEGLITIDR